ncbi:proprotein convertase subtilisin/kexin type 5-like [Aplochiton taeniatus]
MWTDSVEVRFKKGLVHKIKRSKECEEYYFLHQDGCVDSCPGGFYPNSEKKECMGCHADCVSCDGPDADDCEKCRHPLALRYRGECLPECPTHTYRDRDRAECRGCDGSCLTCSGPEPSSCLQCGDDLRLDASGHCVFYSQCPLHSYRDKDGDCGLCPPSCHRCSGPHKDQCLSCNALLFLLNMTCVDECPVGYYGDQEDQDSRVCERCHHSCVSCVGRHSVECVTCKPELFKLGKACVESCGDSHYGDGSTGLCERCDPSCGVCKGRGVEDCLTCRDGYLYLKQWGRCLKTCPDNFYHDTWEKSCRRCHPTCKTCNNEGAISCQSCFEGYKLFGGICDSQCLIGFYVTSQAAGSVGLVSDPKCGPCHSSCMDCRGPGRWNCTVCPALQILSDDRRCMSCCGNEMRRDHKPLSRECCDCEASREECVPGVNFVFRNVDELLEVAGASRPAVFISACVLLTLALGGGVFVFLRSRNSSSSSSSSFASFSVLRNKVSSGYRKVDSNGTGNGTGNGRAGGLIAASGSAYGEYSDRIVKEEEEEEEEENEDDDIVYMGQDGIVYRKFKYGLLEEDEEEEMELEYDDESYSFT